MYGPGALLTLTLSSFLPALQKIMYGPGALLTLTLSSFLPALPFEALPLPFEALAFSAFGFLALSSFLPALPFEALPFPFEALAFSAFGFLAFFLISGAGAWTRRSTGFVERFPADLAAA